MDIKASPEEIAALVVALQERQKGECSENSVVRHGSNVLDQKYEAAPDGDPARLTGGGGG